MKLGRLLPISALSAMVAGGVLVGTAASASAGPYTAHCGDVITTSVTLTNDIGPCTGDGLRIKGSNITVDLAGHTITGSHGMAAMPTDEQVGINLINASNVTLRGPGTVQLFDAGVAINGGGGNTVQGLTVRNNVNYNVVYDTPNNDVTPTTQQQFLALVSTCDYGDGITTYNSGGNRVTSNTVVGNGPYSGISFVGRSDGNVATRNKVTNQLVRNVDPTGRSTICGASFTLGVGMQLGRGSQDVGIRVEGPGADRNRIVANTVKNSMLAGISMNANVCIARPGGAPVMPPNTDNYVQDNTVSGTTEGSNIAIFASGPIGTVTCPSYGNTITGNTSTKASENGIFVSPMSHDNTINNNTVNANRANGILLSGPFTSGTTNVPGATGNELHGNSGHNNRRFDGRDDNPNCDSNHWSFNNFGTVNQGCVQ